MTLGRMRSLDGEREREREPERVGMVTLGLETGDFSLTGVGDFFGGWTGGGVGDFFGDFVVRGGGLPFVSSFVSSFGSVFCSVFLSDLITSFADCLVKGFEREAVDKNKKHLLSLKVTNSLTSQRVTVMV